MSRFSRKWSLLTAKIYKKARKNRLLFPFSRV